MYYLTFFVVKRWFLYYNTKYIKNQGEKAIFIFIFRRRAIKVIKERKKYYSSPSHKPVLALTDGKRLYTLLLSFSANLTVCAAPLHCLPI